MNAESALAFTGFAFVTSVTPGPNNLMLLASGGNFGIRRSLPHLLGISLGLLVLVSAAGLGLGQLLSTYPPLFGILQWLGAGYLLWLAWRISGAAAPQAQQQSGRQPMTLCQAALFQWVNPKAWIMALGAVTTFLPADPELPALLGLALLFALINGPSCALWVFCGSLLRQALQQTSTRRLFNWSMAALLLLSLYPVLPSLHGIP